ncbi:hypothetical protein [Herminiimonas sp. CN]|uniref:hypothetical protein n=1 Tax=Herminiimonas sp. CN TaxID=1349818 RepID=UPI000473A228|nr:hypothetical protein [Herminiimonas sp. CN]
MSNATLPRARAIFPRPETDALLEAWFAYDAKLKAAPCLSAMTQRRRDVAADALYDLMFLASTALTKADVPPPLELAAYR